MAATKPNKRTEPRKPKLASTIGGMDPASYAALWGDGRTADGVLFYNCSASDRGRAIANPEWTPAQWAEFAAAVDRQRERTAASIGKPIGDRAEVDPARDRELRRDVRGLAKLAAWARALATPPAPEPDPILGAMLRQYVVTMLWADLEGDGDSGPTHSGTPTPSDLAPETLAECRTDCAAFLEANRADCAAVIAWHGEGDTEGAEHIGHNLYLTRCGHGCGFRDRGYPRDLADRLTAAAKGMGEVHPEIGDDGRVYV